MQQINLSEQAYLPSGSTLTLNGNIATPVTLLTGDTTLTIGGFYVVNTSGIPPQPNITLPDATLVTGQIVTIKNLTNNPDTLLMNTQAGQTIDGNAPNTFNVLYNQVLSVISDGANWQVTGNSTFISPLETLGSFSCDDTGISTDGASNMHIGGTLEVATSILSDGSITLEGQSPLIMFDSTGVNTVTLSAPATLTSSYSLLWPLLQGGAGTVLTNDGAGNLSWNVSGGGGNSVTTVTTTYTAAGFNVIQADASGGAFTVTLPAAASSANLQYTVKKIDNVNVVTVMGNAAETIDGSNTQLLNTQWSSITVVCNGTSWIII